MVLTKEKYGYLPLFRPHKQIQVRCNASSQDTATLHYYGFDSWEIDLVDDGGRALWKGIVFDALSSCLKRAVHFFKVV